MRREVRKPWIGIVQVTHRLTARSPRAKIVAANLKTGRALCL